MNDLSNDPPDRSPARAGRRRLALIVAAVAVAVALGVGAVVVAANQGSNSTNDSDSATGSGAAARDGTGATRAPWGRNTTPVDSNGSDKNAANAGAAGGSSGSGSATTARGGSPGTSTVGETGSTKPVPDIPPEIVAAYTAGYRGECVNIWSRATSDGQLWDPDDPGSLPHSVDECYAGLDVFYADAWDTVADAREGGASDADSTAEDMTVGNRFRNANAVIFAIP